MQKFGVARTTPVWPCGGFGHPQKAKRRKKKWRAGLLGVVSATLILQVRGGQTTPKAHPLAGHRGWLEPPLGQNGRWGAATPHGQNGVAGHP
jgi:hypothetical protein